MKRSTPERAAARECSVMRTLEVVGDFWTLGVLRCAALGSRRFGDFERELGIATNVLADRLQRLVDAGVLQRVRYSDRPPRDEYVLSARGRDLAPVLSALKAWGDAHLR